MRLKIIKDFKRFKGNEIIEVEIEGVYEEGRYCCDAIYLDGEHICDMGTSFFEETFEEL